MCHILWHCKVTDKSLSGNKQQVYDENKKNNKYFKCHKQSHRSQDFRQSSNNVEICLIYDMRVIVNSSSNNHFWNNNSGYSNTGYNNSFSNKIIMIIIETLVHLVIISQLYQIEVTVIQNVVIVEAKVILILIVMVILVVVILEVVFLKMLQIVKNVIIMMVTLVMEEASYGYSIVYHFGIVGLNNNSNHKWMLWLMIKLHMQHL